MFIRSEVYAKPGELLQGVLFCNKPFLLRNKSSHIFKSCIEVAVVSLLGKQKLNTKSQKAIEVFWSTLSNKE